MIEKDYGKRQGLESRLDAAAERLARDRSMPWLGTGLYNDLKVAAAILRGEEIPADTNPPSEKPALEFDL